MAAAGGRRRAVVLAAALLPVAAAAQAADSLAPIDDLRPLLAAVARDKRPLLLFFSTPGCPYCREVRRGYLRPRVQEGPESSGVAIREVEITSGRRLLDENGQSVTEAQFAVRFGVKVVPHVLLVDARLRSLGEPLIGIDASGFYEGYLQSAIEAASRRLQAN